MPPELVYEINGERVSDPLTGDKATIGRSGDNDVVIRDALVSRHHARLFRPHARRGWSPGIKLARHARHARAVNEDRMGLHAGRLDAGRRALAATNRI